MSQSSLPPDDQGYQQAPVPTRPARSIISGITAETPLVTYILLGITVFFYLLQVMAVDFAPGIDQLTLNLMKINSAIDAGQLWRLITPMFLHGSIIHLGFNMYALFIFGPNLERHYGHARFLTLYFLSGFAGNVMSYLFSTAPSLGSSTAIFGLLGAEGVFLYQNRSILGSRAQRALMNLLVIAGVNFMIGLSPGSNLDNWGHFGGLLGGSLFAWYAGPLLQVRGVPPAYYLVDARPKRDVIRAAISIIILFASLAAVAILLL
jgi:rhomboid protease GluP